MADNIPVRHEREAMTMAAIILGKNLLTEDELIEYAFSDANEDNLNLMQLREQANDAAIHSSLMLIRMMKIERIFVETPAPEKTASTKSTRNLSN